MRDPKMAHLTDVEVLGELWRRRVEYLWRQCEMTAYEPLDIEKLDAMIEEDERAHKAPKR